MSKALLNTWKFMNRGLIAKRDETQVIGTFHVDRSHEEPDYIRALIVRAEALHTALSRVMRAANARHEISPDLHHITLQEAQELLDEIADIRMTSRR